MTLETRLKAHFAAEDEGLDRLVPHALAPRSERDTTGLSLQDQADLAAFDGAATVWDAARPAPPRRSFGLILGGLAAAAALLFFVLRPGERPRTTEGEQLTTMGAHVFELEVAVKRGDQARRVEPGDTLKTGDTIGLFYTAHAPGHLQVLFVGAAIDVLVPSREITAGERIALPAGGELTAATGCEYVVGLYSKEAVPVEVAREALANAKRDDAACTLTVTGLEAVDVKVIGIRR